RDLAERARLALHVEGRRVPSGDPPLDVEPDPVRVDLVERMVREESVEAEVERAGDHGEAASRPGERAERSPRSADQLELRDPLEDLAPRRAATLPVADVERDPLGVGDLASPVPREALFVHSVRAEEPLVQDLPDDLVAGVGEERAVD